MAQDHLQQLPVEVLIQIFQSFSPPDFHALSSLANTSRLLASIFDNHAIEIVDTLIYCSTKWLFLPDVMRMVIYIRSGVFKCCSWDMDLGSKALTSQKKLITSLVLRKFLRLAAKIHVLAHVCMDRWLHLCKTTMIPTLKAVVEQEEEKEDGDRLISYDEVVVDPPSWAEEHRVFFSLWLVQYMYELKIARLKGRLQEGWTAEELSALETASLENADRYWKWGYSTVVEHQERMGTLRDTLGEMQREETTLGTYEQGENTSEQSLMGSSSTALVKSLRLPDPGRSKGRVWKQCHNSTPPRSNIRIMSFHHGLLEHFARRDVWRIIRPLPKGFRRFGLYFWDWTRITNEIGLWPDMRTRRPPGYEPWNVYLARRDSCERLVLTVEEIKRAEEDDW